jgi:hypothetical protein
MSEVQRQPGVPGLSERPVKICLYPVNRGWLHERIEQRFQAMLAKGMVGECLALFRRADLGLHLPALRAVGYRQVWHYIYGQYTYHEMLHRAVNATRQYAKRQLTWMRRHFPAVDDGAEQIGGDWSGQLKEGSRQPGRLAGQTPGRTTGQTPGQTPGQIPGQTPGRLPGQLSGQSHEEPFGQSRGQQPVAAYQIEVGPSGHHYGKVSTLLSEMFTVLNR